jgi:polyisoprenoid-binding protein YceI
MTVRRSLQPGSRAKNAKNAKNLTAPVTLEFEANGFIADPYGSVRSGFSARLEIDRQDFGVSYNGPIPGADNAMVLSDKVSISLEIEAILRKPE